MIGVVLMLAAFGISMCRLGYVVETRLERIARAMEHHLKTEDKL